MCAPQLATAPVWRAWVRIARPSIGGLSGGGLGSSRKLPFTAGALFPPDADPSPRDSPDRASLTDRPSLAASKGLTRRPRMGYEMAELFPRDRRHRGTRA